MPEIILRTENLIKRYGALTAVDGLSLEIHAGEVFGFLGPNGAGKTTSINMMCGLLKPDAGRVFLRGQPLNGGDPAARSRVGMCPQSIVLWERLTCLEQLQFIGEMYGLAAGEARRRGMKLLEALDLAEKRSQQTRTLSGGMQRRLNLAMALVHDPEVVVLDEPEAGLDPQSRVLVREYIQTLARQKTVILTTHNMDEAERLVERVAIIDHGRLLVLDTPEALKWQLGPGDVVEVQVVAFTPSPSPGGRGGEAAVEQVRVRLEGLASEVSLDEAGRRLRVRVRQAVASLPAILAALEAAGLQPGEVSLRANSLEDVFLQLTGRSLRE